jgi:hypothetical protein
MSTEVSSQPPLSRWARIRALLIAIALVVELTHSLPDRAVDAQRLERPEAQRIVNESDRWLAAVGLSPGRPALGRMVRRGSEQLVAARALVLRPFEPLFRLTVTGQQWGLFLLGTRECFRIHVEVRRAGSAWRELYRAQGDGPAWLSRLLRYRRVRGIYNPGSRSGPRGQYEGFVHALAREVLARDRQLNELRVRMERLHIVAPGSAPESLGLEHGVLVTRAELARP